DSAKIAAMPSIYPYPYYKPKSFIRVFDLSDKSKPTLERNITIDGNYVDARMIGNRVYVVMNSPIGSTENVSLPVIADNGNVREISAPNIYFFPVPDYSYGFTEILS